MMPTDLRCYLDTHEYAVARARKAFREGTAKEGGFAWWAVLLAFAALAAVGLWLLMR